MSRHRDKRPQKPKMLYSRATVSCHQFRGLRSLGQAQPLAGVGAAWRPNPGY